MVAGESHGSMQRFHFFDNFSVDGMISERVDCREHGILKVCSSIRSRIRYLYGPRGMNLHRSEAYRLSVNRVPP